MSEIIITFFASFLIWFLFGGLFVLWLTDGKIRKEQVLHAIISALLAWVVAGIIKKFLPTVRPFITNGTEPLVLWLWTPIDSSFPSGHTASSFALATTIFLHDRKVGAGFLAAALVVGSARVLANVHYPIDILGGAVIGTATAYLIEKVHFKKFTSQSYRAKSRY